MKETEEVDAIRAMIGCFQDMREFLGCLIRARSEDSQKTQEKLIELQKRIVALETKRHAEPR